MAVEVVTRRGEHYRRWLSGETEVMASETVWGDLFRRITDRTGRREEIMEESLRRRMLRQG